MKVAFYLENKKISAVDLRYPELGNPGCGGTEYLFVSLPYYLEKLYGHVCEVILFANCIELLPKHIVSEKVASNLEAARRAKILECNFFVYRPRRHKELEFLKLIDSTKLQTIAWAHVTPLDSHLRLMSKIKSLRAIVCVEHEQYDRVQDSPAYKKLTYIVNGFDVDGFQLKKPPAKVPGLVVYIGALVPQKGFHLLARAWPKILKRCPDAKLKVIGSGALYNNDAQLGPWGVAEYEYEINKIIPYLSSESGGVHPSVEFMGKLGIEKKDLLYKAAVGVPNPSGHTENCPGCAIEFEACNTAVVSGAYYGLLDTVIHGETGLLAKNHKDLVDNICLLLEDSQLQEKLGNSGARFVRNRYDVSKVSKKWVALFDHLIIEEYPKRTAFKSNIFRRFKWVICINRCFQVYLGKYTSWPTLRDCRDFMKKVL